MKRAKKVLGGIAALALAMFLAPGIAQAADYTADCAGVPSNVSGNIDINDTSCTISHDVEATGYIRIQANSINADKLKSTGGAVLLISQGSLETGEVEAGPDRNVDLYANQGGGNSLLKIGTTGSGAVEKITVHPTTNVWNAGTVISVTNGTTSSTGGIQVVDGTKISNAATGSARAGWVYLNAQDGTLTMTSLLLEGSSSVFGGAIALMANTINFANDSTLSVQSTSPYYSNHGINIAATTVNFGGTTDGLRLNGNGNGGYVQLLAKGAVTVSSSLDPAALVITGSTSTTVSAPTSYVGGSSPLTVTADGSSAVVQVSAKPISFAAGAITLQSKGPSYHYVWISNPGTLDGSTTGLTFSGSTGGVNIDASGDGGKGGSVSIVADKASITKPTFSVKADGHVGTNSDGGTIYVDLKQVTLGGSTVPTVSANGGGTGKADPYAIVFYPGNTNITVGTGTGKYSFTANGGSAGGDGGGIVVQPYPGSVTLEASGISAKGQNGDGKGGTVSVYGTIYFSGSGTAIDVTGHGAGTGGQVQMSWNSTAIGTFNVNDSIKVDGGNSLLSADENNFGRISMNGVTCQQRTTGISTWPKAYWNCVDVDTSSANDKKMPNAAKKLHSTMKSALGTEQVHIYVMNDILAYNAFFRVAGPSSTEGIAGYSYTDLKVSAAFKWELYGTGNKNTSSYYSGTIIHELAHQLDENVWNDASQNDATWLSDHGTANTAFDSGYPGTCATVVDADRTDPGVGLSAICGLFDGTPGHSLKTNSQGLHDHGGHWFLDKRERFARAFENAYQRANTADIFVQLYDSKVDARLPAEQSYMNSMIAAGAP